MTSDTATRATAIIRKVPSADGKSAPFDAHGWRCTCGADQGNTVLATAGDAQGESHLSTVLGELGNLHEAGNLKVGATFLGDIVRYTQDTPKGLYVETAARGRYIIDDDSVARPYTDGPSRPE
jgi:hypothetical protein